MKNIYNIRCEELHPNKGQIKGLPKNPRSNVDLEKLKKSIQEIPYFLEARPIVAIRHENENVVIAGNQRLRAAQELGFETVPCYILSPTTPISQLQQIAIIDNTHAGKWDKAELFNFDIDESWCLEVSKLAIQKAWEQRQLHFFIKMDLKIKQKGDFFVTFLYSKDKNGDELDTIKETPTNVQLIARDVVKALTLLFQNLDGIALITTPKRRHLENNFAENICFDVANQTGLHFYPNAVVAKNRVRINPDFNLTINIQEKIVILFDDIITTGSTIRATRELLREKTVYCIVGFNNN